MFQKNQYKKLQVEENGFSYKGQFHSFDEIKHILFERVITTERMNFMKVGEPESARLILTLENGIKIKLSFNESTIFIGINTNKQEHLKNLFDLYVFLSEKTFQKRILHYVRQVEQKGYFVYDNCYFYPKDKIVFKNKVFPLKTSSFLKAPGYIELRKKDFGFLDKVKREASLTKTPSFDTCTDTDVIFTLLKRFFGLRWKS